MLNLQLLEMMRWKMAGLINNELRPSRPKKTHPTGAALRNPREGAQALRIAEAAFKRVRRAEKLQYNTAQSIRFNIAHIRPCDGFRHPNPFYIAK